MKNLIKIIAPPAFYKINIFFIIFLKNILKKKIIDKNKTLKNIHSGERCFILGNAPSVANQNLLPLRNEIVFSVSQGYKNRFYKKIKPKYHVFPIFSSPQNENLLFFKNEAQKRILADKIFFNILDRKFINESQLFSDKDLYYLSMFSNDFMNKFDIPQIDKTVPGAQSVPIMAIMIAMYMGFKDIYLLGVHHDWFITKKYEYSFTNFFRANDSYVKRSKIFDELPIINNLFSSYRALHKIAKNNNINIYNASEGGILDEFEFQKLKFLKF